MTFTQNGGDDFYGWRGWEDHKISHKCMTPKFAIFYDVQISKI